MSTIEKAVLVRGLLEYVKWDLFEKDGESGNSGEGEKKADDKQKKTEVFQQIQSNLMDYNWEELLALIVKNFRMILPALTAERILALLEKHQGKVKQVFFMLFLECQLDCPPELASYVIERYPDDLNLATRWAYAEMMARKI